jgi:hypothetical protein
MKILILIPLIALVGCAKDQSLYSGPPPTSALYYAKLNKTQQRMFGTGYVYGQQDAAGRYEQAFRNAMSHDAYGGSQQTSLQRKVESIPVGGYQDSNGVWRSPDRRFIEINTVQ